MATTLFEVTDKATGAALGAVFWDEEWDAYGYETEAQGANGPCPSKAEALADLLAEIDRDLASVLVEHAP